MRLFTFCTFISLPSILTKALTTTITTTTTSMTTTTTTMTMTTTTTTISTAITLPIPRPRPPPHYHHDGNGNGYQYDGNIPVRPRPPLPPPPPHYDDHCDDQHCHHGHTQCEFASWARIIALSLAGFQQHHGKVCSLPLVSTMWRYHWVRPHQTLSNFFCYLVIHFRSGML